MIGQEFVHTGRPSHHLMGMKHAPWHAKAITDNRPRVTSNRHADPRRRLTPFGLGSGDIDARDIKTQETAEGCAEYEGPQEYRQYR
jgi:hypothetical protein